MGSLKWLYPQGRSHADIIYLLRIARHAFILVLHKINSLCRDVVRDEILSIHSHHNFKPNSCQWQGAMLCIQSVVKASFIPTPGPLFCILGYNHLGCNDLTWMTPDTNL